MLLRLPVIRPLVIALLTLAGCRDELPCPDCNDVADETPPTDLPCGGADLMTDNLNCGSCGHECALWWPETEVGAGFCVDGVCGPGWSDLSAESNLLATCADVCTAFGQSCVSNGCAGYTGILFNVNFDSTCCFPPESPPVAVIEGDCNAPIPWTSTSEDPREVMCCCDFQ
jgi:hypothetical protein